MMDARPWSGGLRGRPPGRGRLLGRRGCRTTRIWRPSRAQPMPLDVTGGMLDANPDLSICPEATRTFPGQPGLILRDGDGTPLLPKFCLPRSRQRRGTRARWSAMPTRPRR